jgi:hypothetical protein
VSILFEKGRHRVLKGIFMHDFLVTQVISLSWFRCLMEEGYDFVNKLTGKIETDEIVIYKSFQANTGHFDMPAALASPKGLEKNLLEVIGNLVINNTNPTVKNILNSAEFVEAIKKHIDKIKNRDFSGKLPA